MSGTALFIVAGIVMFVAISDVVAAVVLPTHQTTWRVAAVLLVSVLLLVGSVRVLREKSLLWQVPLQAFAIATLAVGLTTFLQIAFSDPSALLSSVGVRSLIAAGAGIFAGWAMKQLQARHIPDQDA